MPKANTSAMTHRNTTLPCVMRARCRKGRCWPDVNEHRTRGGRSLTGSGACGVPEEREAARGMHACLVLVGLRRPVGSSKCSHASGGPRPSGHQRLRGCGSGQQGEFRSGCGRIWCECDAISSQRITITLIRAVVGGSSLPGTLED